MSQLKAHAIRLKPGQDLKKYLVDWAKSNQISAATVLSSVGSLTTLRLRLANTQDQIYLEQPFEIISLNGTLSAQGIHLHLSAADCRGQTWGGHLLDGNLIYTTCELVILEMPEIKFTREVDKATGFLELKVSK